jgi:alpha-N-arabinofuranosidase
LTVRDSASLERPDAIASVARTLEYAGEFALELEPYTVAVVEFRAG